MLVIGILSIYLTAYCPDSSISYQLEARNIVRTKNTKFFLVNFGQPVYKETRTSEFLMEV